jgi:hypothetical protein
MREALSGLKLFILLTFIFVIASPAALQVDQVLRVGFDASGLTSLKFGDVELLTSGSPELARFKSESNAGKPFNLVSKDFDSATKKTQCVYDWGQATIAYKTQADRLLIDVTVTNKSDSAITDVGFDLLKIQFPTTPTGTDWEHRYGMSYESPDALPAIVADWTTGKLALCSEDLNKPVKFRFRPLSGDPYAIALWFDDRPIAPGTSRSASISIRLAGNESPGWTIARDVLHKFAEKYPSELRWSDRRPIGSAFLSTSIAGYKNNPRGWFLDPDLNVNTAQGRAKFHTDLMAYADRVIAHCKLMDAQGVIVWDLEGQEMPHATSYIADPRMLSQVAPEMDAVANEFFKRLTDAGLRTGVTIRPTRIEPLPDGKPGWTQVEVADPVAEMDSKMSYATKRWGCTLFYLDSNVNFVRDASGKILNDPAMPAVDFQTLARKHKDCLLIPEHKTARYWAYTAPYSEFRLGFTGTASQIHETYPNAFSVMQVVDGPPLDSETVVNQLAADISAGDILLFRPWWDDPTTAQIKQIYTLAKSHPNASK